MMVSEYSVSKYGIKTEQAAKNLDELQTLIQIKCSQGKEIGQYGPRMAYYSAYSSICVVSIIDYKLKQTIGKKTFVNAKRPKTIPADGYDFITPSFVRVHSRGDLLENVDVGQRTRADRGPGRHLRHRASAGECDDRTNVCLCRCCGEDLSRFPANRVHVPDHIS